MSKFELKLPKMGESVAEATITNWLKSVGDTIDLDEPIVEIATDKVDSEVPSEVEGKLIKTFFEKDDVVQVGEVIALIEIDGDDGDSKNTSENLSPSENSKEDIEEATKEPGAEVVLQHMHVAKTATAAITNEGERFYSPLVKNIAHQENISQEELDAIKGSGLEGRVTKDDVFAYLESRKNNGATQETTQDDIQTAPQSTQKKPEITTKASTPVAVNQGDEIIEMTRMGKLIAKHMVASAQTSAHVQSFIEVDVTNIWNWRNAHKDEFQKREGEKLTFTPIFMEAVAKAIKDFPMINIAVDGDRIIKKKQINLGMAAALPDGNLIVPVIKNADQLNLTGMAKAVNDLAKRSREGKLKPDETQNGTYTVTNVGTFGSIMGTPIINQPQVAILALGAIRKTPAVIETPEGDFIGIRHKMYLSHSYDHRVVNGALGGQFVQRVAHYLEAWDAKRTL
ncbi:MAG: dihydrolipoamide acetyltransferase family protein [Leeuwenhoekiella sp.]